MKAILGPIPVDFTKYWIQRFPNLVSHSFHALESCSKENIFQTYYNDSYTFSKPEYFYQCTEEFVPQEPVQKVQRESPLKKYSKELRHRFIERGGSSQETTGKNTAANSELMKQQQQNKRGSYNFHKTDNGNGIENALNKENDVNFQKNNWRKRKENTTQDTVKWTLPNSNIN